MFSYVVFSTQSFFSCGVLFWRLVGVHIILQSPLHIGAGVRKFVAWTLFLVVIRLMFHSR